MVLMIITSHNIQLIYQSFPWDIFQKYDIMIVWIKAQKKKSIKYSTWCDRSEFYIFIQMWGMIYLELYSAQFFHFESIGPFCWHNNYNMSCISVTTDSNILKTIITIKSCAALLLPTH